MKKKKELSLRLWTLKNVFSIWYQHIIKNKMDLLYDNILEFKILNYNDQCKCVINKLLSIKSYDITHTVFYKTLL